MEFLFAAIIATANAPFIIPLWRKKQFLVLMPMGVWILYGLVMMTAAIATYFMRTGTTSTHGINVMGLMLFSICIGFVISFCVVVGVRMWRGPREWTIGNPPGF